MWKTVVIYLIRVNPLWVPKFFFSCRVFHAMLSYNFFYVLRIYPMREFFLKNSELRISCDARISYNFFHVLRISRYQCIS